MAVTFYFAIGRDYRKADLEIALAVGQRHFLVPAGSLGARRLRCIPDIHVALDSEAFPLDNPKRISLPDYWDTVLSWRCGSGDWGCLDWFAAYDTIGDPDATRRDEHTLCALIARDALDAPLLKVVGFGMPASVAAAAILAHPLSGEARPSYGIGGLAVQRYSIAAERWYQELLNELERTTDEQRDGIQLHLFGIGKPAWVLRSTRGLVTSCDSSGPARLAGVAGSRRIATRYTPIYGIPIEQLQRSRAARLAYYLSSYRQALGLPWNLPDETLFVDDPTQPAALQHALSLDMPTQSERSQRPHYVAAQSL
jgi:hypothetical protein